MATDGADSNVKEASGEVALRMIKEPQSSALAALTLLDIKKASLTEVPSSISQCTNLRRLDVGANPLSGFPEALAQLPKLEILFASATQLTGVPAVLARCSQLKVLGVKDCQLQSLDCNCLPESLTWLIAAGNQIHSMPGIERLQHVRKLMLSHNQLTCEALAPAAGIADLEMLRVASNRLESFPQALLQHPKLAWVAIGSNPCTEAALQQRLTSVPALIDFSEVSLGEKLGSGAGATVSKADWKGQQVAVKIWEADRFSDGTAWGEWAITRLASSPGHPSLIQVLGAFEEPRRGMLLELLNDASSAAGPPALDPPTEPTRDVLNGPPFSPAAALSVARAVCNALAYLHRNGILHGDVYLHNTLVVTSALHESNLVDVSDVRLSDFGGACAVSQPGFENLEVRSFGWLLQDLLDMFKGAAADVPEVATMRRVRELCGCESVDRLPKFAELAVQLGT